MYYRIYSLNILLFFSNNFLKNFQRKKNGNIFTVLNNFFFLFELHNNTQKNIYISNIKFYISFMHLKYNVFNVDIVIFKIIQLS